MIAGGLGSYHRAVVVGDSTPGKGAPRSTWTTTRTSECSA